MCELAVAIGSHPQRETGVCIMCFLVQISGVRSLIEAEGYAALLHGVAARVAFHIPAAVVCWGTYETMKSLLSR